MVGLTRFELVTPRLSSVCSNQLSYRPLVPETSSRRSFVSFKPQCSCLSKNGPSVILGPILSKLDRRACPTTVYGVSDRSSRMPLFKTGRKTRLSEETTLERR